MKTLSLVLVILGTLGQVLSAPAKQTHYLIDLNIISANLRQEASTYGQVWVINPKSTSQLITPIDASKLKDTTFEVMATSPNMIPNTKTPVYNSVFGIARKDFNEQSVIVIEIWNNGQFGQTLIGSATFTIAQLEQQPKVTQFILINKDYQNVGQVNVGWEHGSL